MRQPFRPATCQDVTDSSLLLLVAGVKQMFQHLLLVRKKTEGWGIHPSRRCSDLLLFFFHESNANVKPFRPTANQASAPGRIIK